MGTRSLTRVIKRQSGLDFAEGHKHPEKACVNMYRHYDGYPKGHGIELAEFLRDFRVVNGLGSDLPDKIANGMGCLAAQLIAYMKDGPGNVYVESPDSKRSDLEYAYYVWVVENKDIWISIFDTFDEKCIFVGKPEKLIEKYDEKRN